MTETNDYEQYIESFAKENFYPSLHLAGSCRMGSSTDPKAIVDYCRRKTKSTRY
jgi:choline dehydrogenase-like flavoprotein